MPPDSPTPKPGEGTPQSSTFDSPFSDGRSTQPQFVKIDGRLVYLWRALDAEGAVLDVLVQSKRDKRAALKLMRQLLKKLSFVPDNFVTDNLRSSGAAARDLGLSHRHERGRWRNNRAENSHQPDPTTGA
jgi:transposase-like protein